MIIMPAVDIKNGECVRLRKGQANDVTVFSSDPAAMAKHWESLGAEWIHIVDLDGAFDGFPKNFELISQICSEVNVPIQIGGGIRDIECAAAYLEAGVSRIIIGTLALTDESAFRAMCLTWPGQVGVALDFLDNKVMTRGWVEDSGRNLDEILPRMQEDQAAFVLVTDISRDGMQTGVNVQHVEHVLKLTDLPVLVAGGINSLDDIKALLPLHKNGLEGVVTGRAVYAGSLDFSQALKWVKEQS